MLVGIAPADFELAKMFNGLLGSAAVEVEKVSEDLTTPLAHLFEPKKRIRTETTRELMTVDEILRRETT